MLDSDLASESRSNAIGEVPRQRLLPHVKMYSKFAALTKVFNKYKLR
jgi:hypothetical protein